MRVINSIQTTHLKAGCDMTKTKNKKYARKTKSGNTFKHPVSAVVWILRGYWVCINGKPVANCWVVGWSLKTLADKVNAGVVSECLSATFGDPYRTR